MDERPDSPMGAIVACVLCAFLLTGLLSFMPSRVEALPADAWITGVVTSDGVTPVPDAYVKVMDFAVNLEVNYSITDSFGEYTFGVPGGFDYIIFVAHGGYYMSIEFVHVMPGETLSHNITLTTIAPQVADVTVKGYVKDELGNPMSDGHAIGLVYDPMAGDMPQYGNWTVPDPLGFFTVNVIPGPAGGGAIAMDFPGYEMTENSSTDPLVSGMTYWFNITLRHPSYADDAVVYGYVTDSSTGLPLGAVMIVVELWNPYSGDYFNFTYTDSSGYYEMNVANGSGEIRFAKGGYGMYIADITVPSGSSVRQDAELIPTPSVVRGNVTDLSSGLPIMMARVIMWSGGNVAVAFTNSTGAYELSAFAGTDMPLWAEADGYSKNMTVISLAPGEEKWQDFGLAPPSAWLVGTITDAFTGTPIPNAGVWARADFYEEWTMTNATGEYFMALVPGTYTVEINAMDYRTNTSTVEVIDATVNIHDVALLPWVLPLTTKVHGWVNDSQTGSAISWGAEVRFVLPDYSEVNSTWSDATGYYEVMVAPTALLYRATSGDHGPAFGSIDATGLSEYRLDIVLDPDLWGPNVSYSQSPAENVSWTNPTSLDIVVQDQFLQQMALFYMVYWKTEGGYHHYYALVGKSASFDPWNPRSDMNYTVAGDIYTVHEEWNATATGGWLRNSTGELYVSAYEIRMYGTDLVYAIRGLYANATIVGSTGTAFFDGVTGEFLMFIFDGNAYPPAYPSDPSGAFSAGAIEIAINVTDPSSWWLSSVYMGMSGLVGLEFEFDPIVPSGDYRVLFWASDWSNHRYASVHNMTVDNDPPIADAGVGQDAVVDTTITLDASASTDNVGIVAYMWEFDDGGPVVLYGEVVDYLFTTVGNYTVTLTVTDGAGHSSVASTWVNVLPDEPPIANAGPDQTVDEDTVVMFDGSASWDDVGITNYTWTIVWTATDAVVGHMYDEYPEHNFTTPGLYRVELVVTDTADQTSAPDIVMITVNDLTPPNADAGPDLTVGLDSVVTFDGSGSSDNSGSIDNYTWTFGDGGLQTLYGVSPQYTFHNMGQFTVALTVRDAAGLTDTDEVVITVIDDVNPVARAGNDVTITLGDTLHFDGSASTDNVGIVSWTWTFTDGTPKTLTGETVDYVFTTTGAHVVTLTVEDAGGNSGTDTLVVSVNAPNEAPVANAGSDQTVEAGTMVTFNGAGSTDDVGITNYTWTFTYDGEPKTLYGASPKFLFEIAGTYTVTLTVRDGGGLTDTDTVTITVAEKEKAKSFVEQYWWAFVVAAIVVAGLVLYFVLGKRGKAAGGKPEPEEELEERELPPPPEDNEL
ncbi:MAG: PKD domain-containing protein [Thermoplasmata archaeon]